MQGERPPQIPHLSRGGRGLESKIYPKAPILEAVVDLRFEFLIPPAFVTSSEPPPAFSESFPKREPISQVELGVTTGADGKVSANAKSALRIGWKLTNKTNDRILQLQQRGFTYSHLPPYSHWGVFGSEAKSLWEKFVAEYRPEKVTRVAVRYINRLALPSEPFEMSEYLTIYPTVPSTMEPMTGVLMQARVVGESYAGPYQSNITLASETRKPHEDAQSFVLDFDVFCVKDFKPDDPEIWVLADSLRDRKNELFESSLTNRAKDKFK